MLEDNARRDNAVGSRGLPATLSPKPAGPDIYLLTSPFRALPSAAILRLTYRDSSHPEAPYHGEQAYNAASYSLALLHLCQGQTNQQCRQERTKPAQFSTAVKG